MGSLPDIDSFKASLSPGAAVVLPQDANYEESIERWSETCKKRAVGEANCTILICQGVD